MKRVFIAHSFERDRDFIDGLKKMFRDFGFAVADPATEASNDVLSGVISAIQSADVLVAVVGSDRPNVFFEIGVAVGARKGVLLVSENVEVVPSDLRLFPCVSRSGNPWIDASEVTRRVANLKSPHSKAVRSYGSVLSKLRTFISDPDYFDSLTPVTFEKLVMDWFLERGLCKKEEKTRPDAPFDFIVEWPNESKPIVVQVKKLSRQSRVSINHVRELQVSAVSVGANLAFLISSSGFTSSAMAFADSCIPKCRLLTVEGLLKQEGFSDIPSIPKTRKRPKR